MKKAYLERLRVNGSIYEIKCSIVLIISDELIENSRFAYLVFKQTENIEDTELEFSNPMARKLLNFKSNSRLTLSELRKNNQELTELIKIFTEFNKNSVSYKKFSWRINNDFYTVHITKLAKDRVLLEIVKEFEHDLSETTHELKRPIQNIKTLTETLLRGAKDNAEMANKFLNSINEEVDRLASMVQNLLKLDSLETSFGLIDMSLVNFSSLLENELNKIQETLNLKEIRLDKEIPEQLMLYCDLSLVEHLISNLLDNAIKYNKQGGSIKVVLKNDCLIIENSTDFLEEKDLDKLFFKFYRSKKATGIKGTGLGLAIVQKIIDIHNWTIKAEYLESKFQLKVSW